MKAVVFGGSGFLGSHVADVLTEKGYKVTIYDSRQSPYINSQQKMVIGDILDLESVEKTVEGAHYVYNFAGIADIDEACKRPLETIKINIIGNTNILEACRKSRVKRFIFASSVYVYSNLASFYRSSKQACELIIENYQETYGLDFTILRYGSLYGRRANEFNFVFQVIKQALTEGKITRKGDGEEIRDYVNVLDAARCSVEVLSEEYKNQHVMITGNQAIKVKDLLNMIKEMLNNQVKIEYLPERIRDHYQITPYSFTPRIAKKLVLPYYHDLGQGILDCIYEVYQAIKDQGDTKIIETNLYKGNC